MKLFFKKLEVPVTSLTKDIEVIQLWEVRWNSRIKDGYSDLGGTIPVIEVFTTKELAENFAESLRQAYKLIRNVVDCDIQVSKAK